MRALVWTFQTADDWGQSHQILAAARIAGDLEHHVQPNEWPGPGPYDPSVYKVPLADILWLTPPPVVDAAMRSGMEAFAGKDPTAGWSWLVQTTHRIAPSDFKRLTGIDPAAPAKRT